MCRRKQTPRVLAELGCFHLRGGSLAPRAQSVQCLNALSRALKRFCPSLQSNSPREPSCCSCAAAFKHYVPSCADRVFACSGCPPLRCGSLAHFAKSKYHCNAHPNTTIESLADPFSRTSPQRQTLLLQASTSLFSFVDRALACSGCLRRLGG